MADSPDRYSDANGVQWVIFDTAAAKIPPAWYELPKILPGTRFVGHSYGYEVEGSFSEESWGELRGDVEGFALANKSRVLSKPPPVPSVPTPPVVPPSPPVSSDTGSSTSLPVPTSTSGAERPIAHRWARPWVVKAMAALSISELPLSAVQGVQAVASLETLYALLWKGGMIGSNNWGAIHCAQKNVDGKCPSGCRPGSDAPYDGAPSEPVCFAEYASPLEGAKGLLAALWKRPNVQALLKGGGLTAIALARAMWETSYYGTADHPEQVKVYADALFLNAQEIAKALGEENWLAMGDPSGLPKGVSAASSGSSATGAVVAIGVAVAVVGVGAAIASR